MALNFDYEQLNTKFTSTIPDGSLFTVTAPPNSNAEILLEYMVDEVSDTQIYTLQMPSKQIELQFENSLNTTKQPTVTDIPLDNPTNNVTEQLNDLDTHPDLIIIHGLDELEREPEREYTTFLRSLKEFALDNNTTIVLYGTPKPDTNPNRKTTYTLSDTVVTIEQHTNKKDYTHYLGILKHRHGEPLEERYPIILTKTLTVDTKRGIS